VLPDDVADHPEYRIHPVLLDAALRQLAAAIPDQSEDASYQAVSVETIRVFAPIRGRAHSHAELVEQGRDGHRGQIVLTDDAGAVLAEDRPLRGDWPWLPSPWRPENGSDEHW